MTSAKPIFELRADATLDRVRATYAQRGTEYGDSWKEAQFLALKATLRKLGYTVDAAHLRAIAVSSLVDVKHNRLEGGYKDDTLVDGIAYMAMLADEMKQFDPKPPL